MFVCNWIVFVEFPRLPTHSHTHTHTHTHTQGVNGTIRLAQNSDTFRQQTRQTNLLVTSCLWHHPQRSVAWCSTSLLLKYLKQFKQQTCSMAVNLSTAQTSYFPMDRLTLGMPSASLKILAQHSRPFSLQGQLTVPICIRQGRRTFLRSVKQGTISPSTLHLGSKCS